jgi:hypothetical protein
MIFNLINFYGRLLQSEMRKGVKASTGRISNRYWYILLCNRFI